MINRCHSEYNKWHQKILCMDKELENNIAFIQVRVDIVQCDKLASEFVRKHFGSDEFSTISGNNENNKLTIGFGYKVDGLSREVGHMLYKFGVKVCVVVINAFAKKRFIEHLKVSGVRYKELQD